MPKRQRQNKRFRAAIREQSEEQPREQSEEQPKEQLVEQPLQHQLVVCESNGKFVTRVNPADISEILLKHDQFVWLDLQDPDGSDIALLHEEFQFHPLAIEDATRQPDRPKVEAYDGYYFLIFYSLRFDTTAGRVVAQPISMFIGANYLVSVHRGPSDAIRSTMQRWQRNTDHVSQDSAVVLYYLLDTLVDDYFPVVDQIAERVDDLEEQIFEEFQQAMLADVFALKRDLLSMRRIVAPERDVLNVLLRREVPIFDPARTIYLQDVYDHTVRITDSIDTYRDLLASVLDAFLSVQSNRLNETVRVLTVTSIILMSSALVAGIYGMNFRYMPELNWRYGYPFALGLMVVLSALLIWFFRRRKLL